MADKWIAGAIKHPGALHRALDVPEDQNIPVSKERKAAQGSGQVSRQARLALTLRAMAQAKKRR